MKKDNFPALLKQNKMKWIENVPCFVADTKKLTAVIGELKKNLPGEIAYSFKTNPEMQIAKLICQNGCSFLVSSPDELENLKRIKKVRRDRIIFQSPSLTKKQLERLLRLGVKRFSIDSWDQLNLVLKNVPFKKNSFELFVRINTGVKVKNPELPYGMDSYLGFPLKDALVVLKKLGRLKKKNNIKLGLHNHLLSQNTYLDVWKKNIDKISAFSAKLQKEGIELDHVNFGGGYPVPYKKDAPSLEQVGKILTEGRKKISGIFPKIKYIYEPGRKLVAESIVLVGQVVHLKKFKRDQIAILNCSLYNAAMDTLIVDLYLPVCCLEKERHTKTKNYMLRGSTPDSLDVFGRNMRLPELKNGDYLIFTAAGAYSFGSEFISLPKVKTICI